MRAKVLAILAAAACACGPVAQGAQLLRGANQGKLPLTAGFSDADGAGGGGLVPLAFITGYGTSDGWGANAHFTFIRVQDFDVRAWGAAVGAFDRLELSYTRQELEVTGTALHGLGVTQDVFGAKVKVLGNAVYLQDSWLPQTAIGVQLRKNRGLDDAAAAGAPGLTRVQQLGAEDDRSVDYYLALTKVFLAQSVLVNLNLRYTEANQLGLLGAGGDRHSGYSLQPEATVAYLLARKLAIGAEYRSKPRNLAADREDDAWDLFLAWAPTRNVSVVAAYLNLGSILAPVTTVTQDQRGAYVSLQVGF